ncbi:hypothetical protein EX895_002094 [Sporisorium graminicola]|uniref:Uncharacterized protein n=1 Tax=Sporisorium graminicola TaxID=280036 RepID=A0A4U7KW62_9BASI|nr:hypothetical protein EX895_002094 [Sporisorium graminicola]TKY88853.1 hypothetical protein EX895_002094 [Sporisorium graminicola]
MYHSLLTASFFIVVLILVYRNRQFFVSLLPEALASRLPDALRPASELPLSHPHSSSSAPSNSFFSSLLSRFSTRTSHYLPIPGSSWSANLSNGLSSSLFDITANMDANDPRSGLDPSGAQDVQTIMANQGVTFDQARLIRHKQILVQNNIDPNTGLPLDSKAVTSLGGRPGSSRG